MSHATAWRIKTAIGTALFGALSIVGFFFWRSIDVRPGDDFAGLIFVGVFGLFAAVGFAGFLLVMLLPVRWFLRRGH